MGSLSSNYSKGMFDGVFIGFAIGLFFTFTVLYFEYDFHKLTVSEETANKICTNLTGNINALAIEPNNDKLICEVPSFDSTTNIIVRKAGEE